MNREKVINDNAIRGLQSAIEISGELVHLRKEHAKAILALLKEQDEQIRFLKENLRKTSNYIELIKNKLDKITDNLEGR